MRLKHLFLATMIVAAGALLVGCVSQQIGDRNDTGRDSVTGPSVPSPSPSPSASPSPRTSPSPSPSPSPVISSLRNGPYGQEVPPGETRPSNNQRPYPICLNGCIAVVTATPKVCVVFAADGTCRTDRDAEMHEHGRELRWSVPVGADVISTVYAWDLNPDGFNVRVRAKKQGSATLRARLCPPDRGGCPNDTDWVTGDLPIVIG